MVWKEEKKIMPSGMHKCEHAPMKGHGRAFTNVLVTDIENVSRQSQLPTF